MEANLQERVIETLLDQIDELKAGPQAKLTLAYFNGRGLAEISRFMLAIAGVEYEDKRYKLTIADGEGSVYSRIQKPEMDADAAAGKFDSNMGRLPILNVDGAQIGGSKAVARYVANNYGLAGSSALEAAQVDNLCECIQDACDAFDKAEDKDAFFTSEETAQGKRALPFYLKALEKIVGSNGFSVGAKYSMADAKFFEKFGDVCMTKGFFGSPKSEPLQSAEKTNAALAKYAPNIAAIVKNFSENPAIKAYIAKRGEPDF